MKRLAVNTDLCIGCHNCEEVCSKAFYKEKNISKAALNVKEVVDGPNLISHCTQCGECIDICPVEAIYRDKNGIVRINKDICVGCFMCVGYCPEAAMMQHDDYIEPFKCISCGLCVKKCPTGALTLETVETSKV
ncbi:4Fe-4S binding protein [Abyssisolibacter fermentans]|uniref:4Fe-4S binding protein n=1 Tax=Abyssisolibacter fermentans TaxID=1766203 RepID=UPI00082FB792|nr:4Fe-4S binding protein [Abyssisolibacter fermentans]